MAGTGDPAVDEEAVGAALAAAVSRTGASIGALYLAAPDGKVLHLKVLCGVPAEFAAPWSRVPMTAPAPVAEAVREQRLVWVASQEELARSYPRTAVALPYPFALAAEPLHGVRRWGAVLLMWPATRPPHMTPRERGHIATSGRVLARLLDEAALAGTELFDDARLRVVPVQQGHRVEGPPLAAADFAERLPGGSCSLDLAGRITYLSGGGAELLGRDAAQLLGTLPWQSLPWLADPAYEDRYRAAVISRKPVAFTACRPPDLWLDFQLYPDASGISVRIVPVGDRPAPWSDREETANGVTPARAGQLYQLMHLAAGLTEVVGVQDVVDLVADQIMPAFGAQGLILSSAESGRLRITGHRGYSSRAVERLDGLPLDTDFTPAGEALRSGIPSFFTDLEEMRRIHPEAAPISGKNAWAFLPLIVSSRPVGICVLSYDRPHRFTAEERAVLTSLAGLVAQALDRAGLYDTKHQLAHGLQQALLPHTLPAIPGLDVAARYLPATRGMDIGGDFYDLFQLEEAAVAAVIGDVQGHNVAAAALMGQVRTAVHAHATWGVPPDQILARTNRLVTDLDPGLFTTCLYAHLDLAARRVCIASAGHPPPLLRLPGCRTRPLDVPPGPPLGVDPSATYPVTEIPLTEGMMLALYTDGLVEAPGVDLDESIAHLAWCLAQADEPDLDGLIDKLLERVRPARQRTDDLALLLLRSVTRPGGGPGGLNGVRDRTG